MNTVTEQSTALTVVDDNPGTLMRRATDVAGVCAEIVKRTARGIQGRKYVCVEGWMSVAAAHGCIASAVNVEKIEGGIRAIGELHRISDGQLLARAEGFVGDDEPTWAKRTEHARRAMAQTRAISRVCRSAFAFVVVMIDGNLSTTPAEEMDVIEHEPVKAKAPAPTSDLLSRISACTTVAEVEALRPEVAKLPKGSEERRLAVELAKAMIEELSAPPPKPDALEGIKAMQDDLL